MKQIIFLLLLSICANSRVCAIDCPLQTENDSSMTSEIEEYYKSEFYDGETVYRKQELHLPRFKAEKGIPLNAILHELFPKYYSNITAVSVLKTINDVGQLKTDFKLLKNHDEIMSYDLFWEMSYKSSDGNIYPVTGTNITMVFKTSEETMPYFVLFVRGMRIAIDDTYIRVTMMIPIREGADDLKTLRSESTPYVTSFLLACEKKDNPQRFVEYEESVKKVDEMLKNGTWLGSQANRALVYDTYGYKPYRAYVVYGENLLNENRFYDAYSQLKSGFKGMLYNVKKQEIPDDFYKVSKMTAECLEKMGQYEMAGYYYSLAMHGGEIADSEYQGFINDYVKHLSDNKTIEYNNDLPIGFLMEKILGVKAKHIKGASLITEEGKTKKILDSNEIFKMSVAKCLKYGTTVVMPYSRTYFDIGDTLDKSKLYYANSIVIHVDRTMVGEELARVNIMIPLFVLDDLFRNNPDIFSFIISLRQEKKSKGRNNHVEVIKIAEDLKCQHRVVEAINAFEYVFNSLYGKQNLTEQQRSMLFHSAYGLGYCYTELGLFENALFYLEIAVHGGKIEYETEYINALVNSSDIRALRTIQAAKDRKYDEQQGIELNTFYAFLKRRECYLLIEYGKLNEAEELLKELLKDPESQDWAEKELYYLYRVKEEMK